MARYGHLEKLQVRKDSIQRFELDEILESNEHLENPPVLLIRCIVDNEDYQLRINEKRAKIIRNANKNKKGKGRRLRDDKLLRLLRGPDRDAYPGTVIVGWETNTDENGEEVEYSEDECRLWLAALPNWLFDRLRLYCMDPANFTNIRLSEEAEDDLAGNLRSG